MNRQTACSMMLPLAILFISIHLFAINQTEISQEPELQLAGGTSALCPTPDQYSVSRPYPEAGPTRIGVGVYILDITKLDDVQQFFTADVYFVLRWKDPRLANPDRGDTSAICDLPRDRVWYPVIQFDRVRRFGKNYRDITMVDAEGNVTYAQRFDIDVSVKLNLSDFPFDKHTLTIEADPTVSSVEEVEFEIFESLTGREDPLSMTGWTIGSPRAEVTTEYAPRRQLIVSKYLFHLDVQRDWGFYLWRTMVPLFFIVFMSWAVFWIDPTQFVRIGLSATSMLTLIAYQFAFASLLPRISYLTRADRFTVCASILIFLALVEATSTSALARHDRIKLASSIDRQSRWIFPAAFIGVVVFAFFL